MPSPAKMLSKIFEINCFSPIFGGSVTKKCTRFFFMIQPHVNHYYEEIQGFNKYFSTAIYSTRVRFVVCEASVAWFCFLGQFIRRKKIQPRHRRRFESRRFNSKKIPTQNNHAICSYGTLKKYQAFQGDSVTRFSTPFTVHETLSGPHMNRLKGFRRIFRRYS